jgi:hypothetical protein
VLPGSTVGVRIIHEPAVPGVALHRTLPELSTATHSEVDGQEMPFSWWPLSMVPAVHGALAGVWLA